MAKNKDIIEDPIQKELVEQFNKAFPDQQIETLDASAIAEVPGWLDTGNYALNWISSRSIYNGFPLGRIVLLSGAAGAGKSMIALSAMRQPDIDYIYYFDSEGGGISKQFAKFMGINTKKVYYQQIETVESLTARFNIIADVLEKNKQTKKKILVIVDSISMLSTEKELNPDSGADMGNRAKVTREFFRKFARRMQSLNMCVVITAHLTQTIGGYGPSEVVSGGTILQYAPSLEVRFNKVNADSVIEKTAKGASMIKIRADIVKSRMGTLGKRVMFDLDMQNGLDRYAGLVDIMRDYGFVIPGASDLESQIAEKKVPAKSSGWWVFKPWVDDEIGDKALKIHERLIAEKISNTGKFREDAIKTYCKDVPWFLGEVQKLLDTIYAVELDSNSEKVIATVEALGQDALDSDQINAVMLGEKISTKKSKKSSIEVVEVVQAEQEIIVEEEALLDSMLEDA